MKNPIRIIIAMMAILLAGVSAYYWVEGPLDSVPSMPRLYETPPQGALRVLFIGNSHTFVHDVPGLLQHLGARGGSPIWVDGELVGGATLEQHWKKGRAARKISREPWDFVVLQEQSTAPAFDYSYYSYYVQRFVERIDEKGATPVIYATWPRASWDPFFRENERFKTPEALGAALNQSFAQAQDAFKTQLAPVGAAWALAARDYPEIQLYEADGNHASLAGAYLAASVFYRVLTGAQVAAVDYVPDGLDPATARVLRQTADKSPDNWRSDVTSPAPRAPARLPAPTRPSNPRLSSAPDAGASQVAGEALAR